MESINNAELLKTWITQFGPDLGKRAMYVLGNKEDAEDLVQDVFISAYHGISRFEGRSSVATWLRRILDRKLADYYRAKYKGGLQISLDHFFDEHGSWKNERYLASWEQDPDKSLLDDPSFNKQLQNCLNKLPEKWGLIVKLAYLDQRNSSEVCEVATVNKTNYWKIMQRSRLQLRECLEINWFNIE